MSDTLRHIMRSAVFNAFSFHIDKRQHKASLDTTEKIYSRTSRDHYLDRIDNPASVARTPYAMDHPSKSAACYLLEMQVGIRVADMAYDANL